MPLLLPFGAALHLPLLLPFGAALHLPLLLPFGSAVHLPLLLPFGAAFHLPLLLPFGAAFNLPLLLPFGAALGSCRTTIRPADPLLARCPHHPALAATLNSGPLGTIVAAASDLAAGPAATAAAA